MAAGCICPAAGCTCPAAGCTCPAADSVVVLDSAAPISAVRDRAWEVLAARDRVEPISQAVLSAEPTSADADQVRFRQGAGLATKDFRGARLAALVGSTKERARSADPAARSPDPTVRSVDSADRAADHRVENSWAAFSVYRLTAACTGDRAIISAAINAVTNGTLRQLSLDTGTLCDATFEDAASILTTGIAGIRARGIRPGGRTARFGPP